MSAMDKAPSGKAPVRAGTVTVDGAESKWISTRELRVGNQGSGTLYVSHGGTVVSAVALNRGPAPRHRSLIVDGAGSMWTQGGDLRMGGGGLNVTGGGSVATSGMASIGTADSNLPPRSSMAMDRIGPLPVA